MAARPVAVVGLILVGLLLAVSVLAASYYSFGVQQEAAARSYASELNGSLASLDKLNVDYQSLLRNSNATISLLVQAVSNLNTSSPVYLEDVNQLATLWTNYLALAREHRGVAPTYSADIRIDYGNGSSSWYNGTRVQPGWNLYTATLVLLGGKVQATWYPSFQEHLVTGIDGRESSAVSGWFVWSFAGGSWQFAQSGADGILVHNGTVFAWTLCGFDQNFNPTCRP